MISVKKNYAFILINTVIRNVVMEIKYAPLLYEMFKMETEILQAGLQLTNIELTHLI